MKFRSFYIRLALLFAILLVTGLGLNGRIVTANNEAGPENLLAGGDFSLHPTLQDQDVLLQDSSAYSGYTRVTDNEEKITVEVPVEWSDIETGEWTYKGNHAGIYVAASADLASFYAGGSQSGVFIGVSKGLANTHGKDGLLDLEKKDVSRQCLHKGRFDFNNLFYTGQYDQFTNCATGTPGLFVFTTDSADKKSVILLRMIVVSEADVAAADWIIHTFQVLGDPEQDDHHDHGHE